MNTMSYGIDIHKNSIFFYISDKNEEEIIFQGRFGTLTPDLYKLRATLIENKLHWQLDISFKKDNSRKREGYAVQNFSMINRIALNLIKNEQCKKRSVKGKRLNAGWSNNYLLRILTN